MAAEGPIRLLPWDCAFFGRRIGRFQPATMDEAAAAACREQALAGGFDCVYLLAGAGEVATMRQAIALGFLPVDVRVTLVHTSPADAAAGAATPAPAGVELRPATPPDVPALRRIAAAVFRSTRFLNDPGFPPERSRELYATWVERAVAGDADLVLVAQDPGAPDDGGIAGFITAHRRDGHAEIGLLAVERSGRGLGRRLVRAALGWAARAGAAEMTVVTQGDNVAAQRTYQREGFVTLRVEHWYHWWPRRVAAPETSG